MSAILTAAPVAMFPAGIFAGAAIRIRMVGLNATIDYDGRNIAVFDQKPEGNWDTMLQSRATGEMRRVNLALDDIAGAAAATAAVESAAEALVSRNEAAAFAADAGIARNQAVNAAGQAVVARNEAEDFADQAQATAIEVTALFNLIDGLALDLGTLGTPSDGSADFDMGTL